MEIAPTIRIPLSACIRGTERLCFLRSVRRSFVRTVQQRPAGVRTVRFFAGTRTRIVSRFLREKAQQDFCGGTETVPFDPGTRVG